MKKFSSYCSALIPAMLLLGACAQPNKPTVQANVVSAVKYTCPMHPQISEDHPGSCPICGMTLVKRSGQASEEAGISLNTVLEPVNSTVISSIKTINPVEKEVPITVNAQGYLDFDSRAFENISARFSGRIEKLYIKSAFQEIHEGERVFDIYSPDLVAAQQDLIYINAHSAQEAELLHSARQKLLLLGMTSAQIDQVLKTGRAFYSLPVYSPVDGHVHDVAHSQMAGGSEVNTEQNYTANKPLAIREGMYVEKGQTVFNVADGHNLWALLKINRSDIAAVKVDQPVQLTLPDVPGFTINARVSFIEPFLQEGEKNTTIRVDIDNMGHKLKVNSLVNATIKTGKKSGFWIPRSALLNLGKTQLVWLKEGSLFKAHLVKTGVSSGEEIQVIEGLSQGDNLAENAQYLSDSESFIKNYDDGKAK